ncbi:MAG: hypothetical protein ABSD97_03385 [Acidimicrobiales bacterium]
MVLFEGFGHVAGQVEVQDLNDTWTWDGSDWVERLPAAVPQLYSLESIGNADSLVWDSHASQLVRFMGPTGLTTETVQNTWIWSGSNWADVTPDPSSPNGGVPADDLCGGRGNFFVGKRLLDRAVRHGTGGNGEPGLRRKDEPTDLPGATGRHERSLLYLVLEWRPMASADAHS